MKDDLDALKKCESREMKFLDSKEWTDLDKEGALCAEQMLFAEP